MRQAKQMVRKKEIVQKKKQREMVRKWQQMIETKNQVYIYVYIYIEKYILL